MSYFLAAEAERELAEALEFYKERASQAIAKAFLAEFARAATLLVDNPGARHAEPERPRIFPMQRFPYSLIYRPTVEGIRISAVAHQRRRPAYWQSREWHGASRLRGLEARSPRIRRRPMRHPSKFCHP